ncbi:MAG: hypothetical protein AAF805_00035 [Planctomycetota bacterium]
MSALATPQVAPLAGSTPLGIATQPSTETPETTPAVAPASPTLLRIPLDRAALLAAVRTVCKITPRKSPKSALTCLRLSVSDAGAVSVYGTDGEASAAVSAGVTDRYRADDRYGACLIPAHELARVLRDMDGPTARIDATADAVRIAGEHRFATLTVPQVRETGSVDASGRGDHTYRPATPDDLPAAIGAGDDWLGVVELPAPELAAALKRGQVCTDTESSRYALGGVKLDTQPGKLSITGTDGRRLITTAIDCDTRDADNGFPNALPLGDVASILPSSVAKLAAQAMAKLGGIVTIARTADALRLCADGVTIAAKCEAGRYPRWRDVVPSRRSDWRGVVDAYELGQACKRMIGATSDERRGVDCTWSPDGLAMVAHADPDREDVVTGSERVTLAEAAAGTVDVTIDPRLLADALGTIPKPKRREMPPLAEVSLTDADGAIVLRWQGVTLVVMPLARDRG